MKKSLQLCITQNTIYCIDYKIGRPKMPGNARPDCPSHRFVSLVEDSALELGRLSDRHRQVPRHPCVKHRLGEGCKSLKVV